MTAGEMGAGSADLLSAKRGWGWGRRCEVGSQGAGTHSRGVRNVGYGLGVTAPATRVTKCAAAAAVWAFLQDVKGRSGPRGDARTGARRRAWERAYVCPRVAGGAAPRDSRQWPLRVTVTGEHTTQSFSAPLPPSPSLPGSVTHPASLIPHSSLHTLPDPRPPGRPAHAAAPPLSPSGARRGRRPMSVTCPGHASNF